MAVAATAHLRPPDAQRILSSDQLLAYSYYGDDRWEQSSHSCFLVVSSDC